MNTSNHASVNVNVPAALLRTAAHENSGRQERGRWTEAIVRDEVARPADISEVFLKDWELREDETRIRQLKVRMVSNEAWHPHYSTENTVFHR